MAFQKGQIEVQVEVQAAPGAFLASSPQSVVVDKGDLATFILTATPIGNFGGPIFLRAVNLAGSHAFSVNPVPAGGGTSILQVDTGGFPLGKMAIGLEAVDVLPPGEDPVGPDGLTAE